MKEFRIERSGAINEAEKRNKCLLIIEEIENRKAKKREEERKALYREIALLLIK